MYRNIPTTAINDMDYFEMREWNKCHELMAQTDKREADKWRALNGG